MKNRMVLMKNKLLSVSMLLSSIVMVVSLLSSRLTLQVHASPSNEPTFENGSLLNNFNGPLVDIEFDDGTIGWDSAIYEAQQNRLNAQADLARTILQQTHAPVLSPYSEVRTMHDAKKTTNQIVIYLVADRYTEAQQEKFFTVAQNIANHIVNSFPISEYKEWVQIYSIGTISPSASISIIAGNAGTASGDITRDNVRPFVQYHFPNITNPNVDNNHS